MTRRFSVGLTLAALLTAAPGLLAGGEAVPNPLDTNQDANQDVVAGNSGDQIPNSLAQLMSGQPMYLIYGPLKRLQSTQLDDAGVAASLPMQRRPNTHIVFIPTSNEKMKWEFKGDFQSGSVLANLQAELKQYCTKPIRDSLKISRDKYDVLDSLKELQELAEDGMDKVTVEISQPLADCGLSNASAECVQLTQDARLRAVRKGDGEGWLDKVVKNLERVTVGLEAYLAQGRRITRDMAGWVSTAQDKKRGPLGDGDFAPRKGIIENPKKHLGFDMKPDMDPGLFSRNIFKVEGTKIEPKTEGGILEGYVYLKVIGTYLKIPEVGSAEAMWGAEAPTGTGGTTGNGGTITNSDINIGGTGSGCVYGAVNCDDQASNGSILVGSNTGSNTGSGNFPSGGAGSNNSGVAWNTNQGRIDADYEAYQRRRRSARNAALVGPLIQLQQATKNSPNGVGNAAAATAIMSVLMANVDPSPFYAGQRRNTAGILRGPAPNVSTGGGSNQQTTVNTPTNTGTDTRPLDNLGAITDYQRLVRDQNLDAARLNQVPQQEMLENSKEHGEGLFAYADHALKTSARFRTLHQGPMDTDLNAKLRAMETLAVQLQSKAAELRDLQGGPTNPRGAPLTIEIKTLLAQLVAAQSQAIQTSQTVADGLTKSS